MILHSVVMFTFTTQLNTLIMYTQKHMINLYKVMYFFIKDEKTELFINIQTKLWAC